MGICTCLQRLCVNPYSLCGDFCTHSAIKISGWFKQHQEPKRQLLAAQQTELKNSALMANTASLLSVGVCEQVIVCHSVCVSLPCMVCESGFREPEPPCFAPGEWYRLPGRGQENRWSSDPRTAGWTRLHVHQSVSGDCGA